MDIKTIVVILLSLVTGSQQQGSDGSFKRVCYYTNWAQYRPGLGMFKPEHIDPFLCTHIVYAFAVINSNHELIAYEWNDEAMWGLVNDHKTTNPNLRTLIAVGGWNFGSEEFSAMVSNAENRAHFISTTIDFLREKNFDGFDCDWEYPGSRGSPAGDKEKFTLFMQEFRQAIDYEAAATGKEKLLLTAAVAAGKQTVDAGYEISKISAELDWVGLMSYDLHGAWDPVTGHNSPLHAASDETGEDAYLNVEWAVNYWLEGGCPRSKLLVGIPTYGRTFTLGTSDTSMGAPASGAGISGTFTREAGFLSYYEVCQKLQAEATRVWDAERRVPYCYLENQWIGYDDPESFSVKIDWVKREQLAGTMAWALDMDDFTGQFCNQGINPLLNLVKSELESGGPVTVNPATAALATTGVQAQPTHAQDPTAAPATTGAQAQPTHAQDTAAPPVATTKNQVTKTISPVQTTPTQAITVAPTKKQATPTPSEFVCTEDGYFPHPTDCNKYYRCAGGVRYDFNCGPGTVFNPKYSVCDWPYNVPGC